jgi:hypothetical protein
VRKTVPLAPQAEERLRELGTVELLVGIPSYNNADTIAHVVHAAAAGLAKYFPDRKAAIVNSDGGSTDGTAEVVARTELSTASRERAAPSALSSPSPSDSRPGLVRWWTPTCGASPRSGSSSSSGPS